MAIDGAGDHIIITANLTPTYVDRPSGKVEEHVACPSRLIPCAVTSPLSANQMPVARKGEPRQKGLPTEDKSNLCINAAPFTGQLSFSIPSALHLPPFV